MTHLGVLASLALRSAWNRRLSFGLIALTIALSVTLLLGVERVRQSARDSFAQSVAGTDLVIGARTSPIQLMLYAIFRIGEATNNIGWSSVEDIRRHPSVAWALPLSLGDSHQGFPVLGTTTDVFTHYRYGDDKPLTLGQGRGFNDIFEATLGAEIADRLGYKVGDRVTLTHGMTSMTATSHGDKPFVVTGILRRTGTPVDRTVHVSLESLEAIHLDWQGGARMSGLNIPQEYVRKFDLQPKSVTAVLVGLKSRAAVFRMQRYISTYEREPLLAVLPGVALNQLWQVVSIVERTLLLVSGMVVLIGLCGLVAVVLAGMNERRRELAILRSVGAQPRDIFILLVMEGLSLATIGTLLGAAAVWLASVAGSPLLEAYTGVFIRPVFIATQELPLLAAVIGTGLLASLVPGYRAYRLSLADGLTPRV